MKELFLLRGLPGSGKSTLAKSIAGSKGYIKEADMYFVDGDGNYNFKPSQIKEAHAWCQEEVEFLMKYEHKVIVSNTFTQEWEMQPYYNLAEKYGYRVYSLIVENRHDGKNQHGVPVEKLIEMKNRFEVQLLPGKETLEQIASKQFQKDFNKEVGDVLVQQLNK